MPRNPVQASADTLPVDRVVLMCCRTLTSTIRLLETHRLFRDDVRLRFVFAVDNGSEFSGLSEQLLRAAGVPAIVDWNQIPRLRPDLTLAASENVAMDALPGNVLLLPHGVGFNKYIQASDGSAARVAGLPTAAALRTGRLRLTLTHPDQDAQLRALRPQAAGHTVVTGDPVLDQLGASMPLRQHYQDMLHAGTRDVVLLSSTWGRESAWGHHWRLPAELLAALPVDEYRVCLALHPNVWARYGRLGVTSYLAKALDAGLVLLPPESGWHAAMVASAVVIADHGSLALYAAALGKPLLLTGDATTGGVVVPGTPMADLLSEARRLDLDRPLAAQVADAGSHDSVRAIGERAFTHRGAAIDRLREEIYRSLNLPAPDEFDLARVPDPVFSMHEPWSLRVRVSTHADETTLTRYPAAVTTDSSGHLVVCEDETDLRLHERAAVVCRSLASEDSDARLWVRRTLLARPGARLAAAAVDGGAVIGLRDADPVHFVCDSPIDVAALGSFAYDRVVAGSFDPGIYKLVLGGTGYTVRIR